MSHRITNPPAMFIRWPRRGGLRQVLVLGAFAGSVGCSAGLGPQDSSTPDTAAAPPALSHRPNPESAQSKSVNSNEPRGAEPDSASKTAGGAERSGETTEESRAVTENRSTSKEEKEDPPAFFEGRDRVTYKEFIDELRVIADALVDDPDVIEAHQVLLREKDLTAKEMPLESFSRVRLAFESARDSGLWGIRGTVTDQMPWSDKIWQQWEKRSFTADSPVLEANKSDEFPTAEAECDELGALFSILARDMGVIGFVGLHWPYWNHVVPVWQIDKKDGTFVRIIVPATQTFLDKRETIGTTGMKTNRVIFAYVRKDRRDKQEISADLARYLLTQSKTHGGLSTREFTSRRLWHRWNHRPGAKGASATTD